MAGPRTSAPTDFGSSGLFPIEELGLLIPGGGEAKGPVTGSTATGVTSGTPGVFVSGALVGIPVGGMTEGVKVNGADKGTVAIGEA